MNDHGGGVSFSGHPLLYHGGENIWSGKEINVQLSPNQQMGRNIKRT